MFEPTPNFVAFDGPRESPELHTTTVTCSAPVAPTDSEAALPANPPTIAMKAFIALTLASPSVPPRSPPRTGPTTSGLHLEAAASTPRAALAANTVQDKNIVETALEAGSFKTLARLPSRHAELVDDPPG